MNNIASSQYVNVLQFAPVGVTVQCRESVLSNSGSKVAPNVIGPVSSQPPPSGGGGASGFMWWPIVASLGGAAMLACCAFFAIAAYRRRKKSKKEPSIESGTGLSASEEEETSLPRSAPRRTGWERSNDAEFHKLAAANAGSGIKAPANFGRDTNGDLMPADPSFPTGSKPVEKISRSDSFFNKITRTDSFFNNLFRRQESSRKYVTDKAEADLEAFPSNRPVVAPIGLAYSDSVMRSLQSQADAVVAAAGGSKTRELLSEVPLKQQDANRVSL